tara:strand:+ start:3601 stop:3771 length:171 start_codon:yes stop_codon:yes gene_type:complete
MISPFDWVDQRIAEINKMPYASNDDHPCFEEVMELYTTKARSYAEFLVINPQFKNE